MSNKSKREPCHLLDCNPTCRVCGDTPSCGDGSWGFMGGFHVHRCRDADPQCGHDVVLCEKHDTALLISALEAQVKALTAERDQACRERADAQHRYTVAMHDISKACAGTTARSACEVVELWRKERDAQAEAVKSACRMAYRASYLGFDHAWGDSQISCIKNKIVRETMQDIARAAVEGGKP